MAVLTESIFLEHNSPMAKKSWTSDIYGAVDNDLSFIKSARHAHSLISLRTVFLGAFAGTDDKLHRRKAVLHIIFVPS